MPTPYTASDAILDTLKAHGVSHIFGYPGGAIMPFYDALPRHRDVKHILTRHEQGAAFMAQGWARTTKQLGVCCATSGPGATNLVTGIADAMMDSIPMLALTGQVFLPIIGKDGFQEVDMCGITLNITKHNYLVERIEDVVPTITEAIAIAMNGRPGPVHVDVPKDILMAEHPRDFGIPSINLQTDPSLQHAPEPEQKTLDAIVAAMKNAKKPVLLLGQGVKHADAEALANQLIEKTGIPTVTTVLAKGTVPVESQHYLGMLGMHGYYHANMAMHHADFICNIGSRFDDRIVGRYDVFGKDATVVHVDIDPSEIGKAVIPDIGVHSDAKVFLQGLVAHAGVSRLDITDWHEQIALWKDEKPYQKETEDTFSMRNCLKSLDDLIAEDPDRYIVAVDVGQHQMWGALSCRVADSTKWLCSGGSGTMGFALPTAIGAAFANPDKTIICISGDGGVQMNLQELGVMEDYGLDVKLCILNNNFLGMVRQWQELVYEKNYSEVSISSPDYKTIASAYSIEGHCIEKQEDVEVIHGDVFSRRGPAVIEYRVDKEDNVFPMVPQGRHLGETIISASDL